MRCAAIAINVLCVVLVSACSADRVLNTASDAAPEFGKVAGLAMTLARMPGLGGSSEAFSVNAAGDVVGYSTDAITRYPFAIRWRMQGSTWTLTKVGPPLSFAEAINESGTIVGKVGDSAAVWLPTQSLQVLGRGEAKGVNSSNLVVGYQWATLPATPAAWTQASGTWTTRILEPIAGDTASSNCLSIANAVSDEGVIVGIAYDSNCVKQTAVAWMPRPNPSDGWYPATPLAGATSMAQSAAYAIVGNTVVGAAWPCATVTGCTRRAYSWSLDGTGVTGPISSLDARANSLDSFGYSAGSYVDRKMHAVLWSPNHSTYVTLPEFNGYDAHWVWDITESSSSGSPRLAAGGATDGRGGRFAVVWTIP